MCRNVLRFSYISSANATIEPVHQNPSGAKLPGGGCSKMSYSVHKNSGTC